MTTHQYPMNQKTPRLYNPDGTSEVFFRPGAKDVLVVDHSLVGDKWREQKMPKDEARGVWQVLKSQGWTTSAPTKPISTVGEQAAVSATPRGDLNPGKVLEIN